MARCLVTGHKGYIGAHLVRKLEELGHEVQGIDLQEEYSKDINSLQGLAEDDQGNFHPHYWNFKPEYIFHLACFPRVAYSVEYPVRTMENNVLCPRCGLFIENDKCTSSSFFDEASGLLSFYCESCDFETPGGRGDIQNDGILGFKYQPWKGNLRFHYLDWMQFHNSIKKKAERVSKHRF